MLCRARLVLCAAALLTSAAVSCSSPEGGLPDGAAPPGSDLAGTGGSIPQQPPAAVAAGPLLWRQFQDVDVQTPAVPAGSALALELWAEGSQGEQSGYALRFTVDTAGVSRVSLRNASDLYPLSADSGALRKVAGQPLRLRLRRAGKGMVLHVDVQASGAWQTDASVYSMDDAHTYFGRRTVVVQSPGAAFEAGVQVQPVAPEGAFSFNRAYDGLIDWKLFQRQGTSGTVPLPFAYQSSGPARLEVDLLNMDGSPVAGYPQQTYALPAVQAAQNMQGALLRVPQGGNYKLRGRLLDMGGAELGADTINNLAVGDVWLAAGQSNMDGYATDWSMNDPATFEAPVDQVHAFGNDYIWQQAIEPLQANLDDAEQIDKISLKWGEHSLILRFAKELYAGTKVPIAVIPSSKYGTTLQDDWARDSKNPRDRGTMYGSTIYRVQVQGYPAPIRGMIWFQGESDVSSPTAQYLSELKTEMAWFRSDLNPMLYLGNCQLTSNNDLGKTPAEIEKGLESYTGIQEAQREYAPTDPLSTLIATVDLPRVDIWHLNTYGVRETGRRLGQAVLRGAYGLKTVAGPVMGAVRFADAGRARIEVAYDKEVKVAARTAALYRVRDALGVMTPTGATGGTTLTLTLPRAAQGTTTVDYGFSVDSRADWVVAADGSSGALAFKGVPVN